MDLPRAKVPRNAKWLVRYGGGRWSAAEDFGGLTVATAKQYHDWFKPHSVYTVSDASRGMLSKAFPSARRPRPGRGCRWPTISGRLVAVRGKPQPSGSWRRDTLEERTFALPLPPDQRGEPARKTAGSLRPAGSSPSRLCRHCTLHMAVYVDITVRIQGIVIHYSLLPLRDGLSFLRSQESPVDP